MSESATSLVNRLHGMTTEDWGGEARDSAGVKVKNRADTMQEKVSRFRRAASEIDLAAGQLKLLRDSIIAMVDDPANVTRFDISDTGTVTIKQSYASLLQLRSNCDSELFAAWMRVLEGKRQALETRLTTQLLTADVAGQYYDWKITNALLGVDATERPFRPRVPSPPPKPKVQRERANKDGSGPAQYRKWNPNWASKVSLQELKAAARAGSFFLGGGMQGMPNAASMMNHYLDNSGSDYKVDVDSMLREIAGFQPATEANARDEFGQRMKDLSAGYMGPVGFRNDYYDHQGISPSRTQAPDWYLATHNFNFQTSGVGIPNDNGGYDLTYQTNVYDYYNFETTDWHAWPQASDLNRLNLAGWAQTFDVTGTSSPKSISVPSS